MKENCWYKNGCPLYKEECEKTCHRYLEMAYLIKNCGMPEAHKYLKPIILQNIDKEAFQTLATIKENIVEFVENGSNLYITSSNPSNGKTTWALKILYKYFDEIWCGNGFNIRGYFIYVPDFIEKIVDLNYKDTEEGKLVRQVIKDADLVIWDDITTYMSDIVKERLYGYISSRYIKNKSNIYTGVKSGNDLNRVVGDKLYSKIWELSRIVTLNGRAFKV